MLGLLRRVGVAALLLAAGVARADNDPAGAGEPRDVNELAATHPTGARELARRFTPTPLFPLRLRLNLAERWLSLAIAQRDYGDALSACDAVEALGTALSEPATTAFAQLRRGAALYELGRFQDARRELTRARVALRDAGCTEHEARCAHNLSLTLGALGDYAGALAEAERAVASRMAAGDDDEIRVKALTAYAATLLRIGDVEGARRAAQQGATVAEGRPVSEAIEAFGTLGQTRAQVGDTEAASDNFRHALDLAMRSGAHQSASIALMNEASLRRSSGELCPALAAAVHAVALAHDEPSLRAYARFEEGATWLALGDFGAAGAALAEARQVAAGCQDADLQLGCLIEEAVLCRRASLFEEALARGLTALAFIERSSVGLSDELTTAGRAQRVRLPQVVIGAAGAVGPEAAWSIVERCRAVALLSSIGGKRAADATDRTEALQALAASAKQAADDLARDVAQHSEAGDLRGEALFALRRRAADAVAAADAARERVQREKGLHAATVPTAFASPADVAAMLRPSQVFVSICSLDDQAFALIVEHGRSNVRYVELGESRKLVAKYDEVREAALNEEPRAAAVARKAGADLLARLALPSSTTSIVLSVDAELADVPFGALAAAGPTPIAVAMAPSATVWQALRAYPVVKDRPALVAGISDYEFDFADTTRRVYLNGGGLASLPTATTEAARAAGANGTLLTDAQATEPAVRAAMGSPDGWDAVHVVCHGVIHPRVPALSGLALRPAGTDDGFFDVREVLDLRIRTNLVVLAACQTGLGKVYAGEGIWGLGRAFMLAGAPRVLVSLWKVDDAATTELMSAFHDGRRAGLGSADALRRAQEHVRETPGWAHPRYWAAWQLWGLPD